LYSTDWARFFFLAAQPEKSPAIPTIVTLCTVNSRLKCPCTTFYAVYCHIFVRLAAFFPLFDRQFFTVYNFPPSSFPSSCGIEREMKLIWCILCFCTQLDTACWKREWVCAREGAFDCPCW
jgi:hypothetical protein